ncbi:hypothetical protein D3C85_1226380 [compost metagenome]
MIWLTVLASNWMASRLVPATWLPCSASWLAVCAWTAVCCTCSATSPMDAAICVMAVAVMSVSARCSSNAVSVLLDRRLESLAASAICVARSLRRVSAVLSRASSLIRIICNCAAGPS